VSDKPATFRSEYWQLHRNSLLFSTALFVLAISSSGGKMKIFDVEFSDLSGPALNFMLLIAATYALIAFLLEWRAECWPEIKRQHTNLVDISGP
jgi:hypothetical protein